MPSMIVPVTANIASGISDAITRAARLLTTTRGADSQTILKRRGVLLRSACSRSRHFGLGTAAL